VPFVALCISYAVRAVSLVVFLVRSNKLVGWLVCLFVYVALARASESPGCVLASAHSRQAVKFSFKRCPTASGILVLGDEITYLAS